MVNFNLDLYLDQLLAHHDHICPRQVLGLRMGIYGARLLGVEIPLTDKRMLAFVETDGCFVDGVSVATNCTLGHRTMRLMDFGKVAVTFVEVATCQAVRIAPRASARTLAVQHVPNAESRWHAQLEGYQLIPETDLFVAQPVTLHLSVEALLSQPGYRVECDVCGEEIINQREVIRQGLTLCRACAGEPYYQLLSAPAPAEPV